jgi:dimethylhistidine N-methyltransferase
MIKKTATLEKQLAKRKQMVTDVIQGLSSDDKFLQAKYFYDARGCELFDAICELPEYYVTRTETMILEDNIDEIIAAIDKYRLMVELGSGSSSKTRLLLERAKKLRAYAPVDIATDYLDMVAPEINDDYESLLVHPIWGDFLKPITLPEPINRISPCLIYFPGSTIGNLNPDQVVELFKNLEKTAGKNGGLLLGMDLDKDQRVLEAAYNDAEGVTAEFNLNILHHIAYELDVDIDVSAFEHYAFYNQQEQRIEMHLRCIDRQVIEIEDHRFVIEAGETICTEHSNKYSTERLKKSIADTNWQIAKSWRDDHQWFDVVLLELQ